MFLYIYIYIYSSDSYTVLVDTRKLYPLCKYVYWFKLYVFSSRHLVRCIVSFPVLNICDMLDFQINVAFYSSLLCNVIW